MQRTVVPNKAQKVEQCVQHYAAKYGFSCDLHETTTKDGFVLNVQNIYTPASPEEKKSRTAVILQHGLLQNSAVFVTNEESSLAFYLAEQGYDVWLGNNRGNHKHEHLTPDQEEYWNWGLDELAVYDFPAIVGFVLSQVPHSRVVYVGHSQGYAQAFAGVCRNKEVASRLKLLVGLAPPVYVNAPDNFVLQKMKNMSQEAYFYLFGKKSFIPLLKSVQGNLPPSVFCVFAYAMFSYLFDWGDRNWNRGRKAKYFQCTPTFTSSKLLAHWCKALNASRIVSFEDGVDPNLYSVHTEIPCPIALFYGERDTLVNAELLIKETIAAGKHKLVHHEKLENYEHLDLLWAVDAPSKLFPKIVDIIEKTINA